MRFRVILLVVATSSLVLVSFLVPLALVLRSFAANEAVSKATTQAQSLAPLVGDDTLGGVVDQMNMQDGGNQVTVFLPGGQRAGLPAPVTVSVERAATGQSFTAVGPAGRPSTATRTSAPDASTVVELRPFAAASRTAAERGAGWPSSPPSGRKTVTWLPVFPAFTWFTVSPRSLVSTVVTSGARFWAWRVAVLTARFAAKVRSTSASGTRKETSTSELVATMSRMTRNLIRAR